jgi:hypothetical protein
MEAFLAAVASRSLSEWAANVSLSEPLIMHDCTGPKDSIGSKTSTQAGPPLFVACVLDEPDVVRFLLSAGADPNQVFIQRKEKKKRRKKKQKKRKIPPHKQASKQASKTSKTSKRASKQDKQDKQAGNASRQRPNINTHSQTPKSVVLLSPTFPPSETRAEATTGTRRCCTVPRRVTTSV